MGRRIEAKLDAKHIRFTLAFSAIFQMVHEMIKHAVLDQVSSFYGQDEASKHFGLTNDAGYAEVLRLAPKNKFAAHLTWLVNAGAIAPEHAERLDAVRRHRHDVTHEVVAFLVDPKRDPDVDLLVDAVTILDALTRFWTQIEADIGTFEDFPDVDVSEIRPVSMTVLGLCLEAVIEAAKDITGEDTKQS